MNRTVQILRKKIFIITALVIFSAITVVVPPPAWAQPAEPKVAIHVSELTQAFETMPATPPTPTGTGYTGNEWWYMSWHYFVAHESLKEALRSDGTPFTDVSDASIAAGDLLNLDGTPKYPILISLASEAVNSNEIAPLLAYVNAGGILFVGSSSFTRNPDGTTRADFPLASAMGLHMATPSSFLDWYENLHFTKVVDHRLVSHIPTGTLFWRMPLTSEEINYGVSPDHTIHGNHWAFQVTADSGTTVIANGDSGPLLATRQYGKGSFIYHGASQPLVGHGGWDPSMYAYLIYRHAIEWAFEAANLPIIKISPWQYAYDSAFIVRHDFENFPESIGAIESSAFFEHSIGVKGDYYFCTGTLRDEMTGTVQSNAIAGLQSAVTNYGATIGSHNGGFINPVNSSLTITSLDYWHWGPDEALDVTSFGTSTYTSGKQYANDSILKSILDIEGWLSGLDNGRAGCGSATCPRIWASPYFNSTREDSNIILQDLGIVSTGEQKISPFPTWTLSTQTSGTRFAQISLPVSDWYVGNDMTLYGGALDSYALGTMQAAVDFYYDLGALINIYGHNVSAADNVEGSYATYCNAKPNIWATNAVGIYDWWKVRSAIVSTPSYTIAGSTATARVAISGATDAGTTIEMAIPGGNISNIQEVRINGSISPDYRTLGNSIKINVGASASSAAVKYTINNNPVPATTSLSPASATVGGTGFTLTVNGSNFISNSVVQWNGSSRTTTYVSATQLTAAIPTADIAATGTAAVNVFTLAPGGGTSNAQTFTINKATPPITAWPTASAITYGQTLASSVLSGGTTTVAGSFAFTTPGTAPSGGTASQSVIFTPTDTANYNTVTGTVSVTVSKAALTVTADNKSKLLGAPNPTLTISYSAFQNGDTAASLTTQPTATTTATTSSPRGNYPITVSGGVSNNYAFTYVNGTLSVGLANQATLNIVAPASLAYGSTATLSTTGGSGTGAVTYSIGASTGCSIAGSTLSVTVVSGTCSVTATKAADTNYSAATSSAATVTLTKANQVTLIIVAPASLMYGSTFTLSTTGGSGTGAVTYSTGTSTGCSVAGSTLSVTVVSGTCSVTATKAADSNYNAATSSAATVTLMAIPNGDLNGDNIVDIADALKALRIAAGLDIPTAADIAHGDVAPLIGGVRTPDGKIDLADVVAILRKAVGLPSW